MEVVVLNKGEVVKFLLKVLFVRERLNFLSGCSFFDSCLEVILMAQLPALDQNESLK